MKYTKYKIQLKKVWIIADTATIPESDPQPWIETKWSRSNSPTGGSRNTTQASYNRIRTISSLDGMHFVFELMNFLGSRSLYFTILFHYFTIILYYIYHNFVVSVTDLCSFFILLLFCSIRQA